MDQAQPSVKFILTGFGPFVGVESNPTTRIIQTLQQNDGHGHNQNHTLSSSSNVEIENCILLETSAESVRVELDRCFETLSTKMQKSTVVFVHLGVNVNATKFKLEQMAYNEATFRVADERGYKPNCICIANEFDLGKEIETELDLASICKRLNDERCEDVEISTDPGRFVCNYAYFYSLKKCKEGENASMCDRNGEKKKYYSVFVHVPEFEVIEETKQLDFVFKLLAQIRSSLEA